MNIELKQTRKVNEKELGMTLVFFQRKTNSTLLVKLKKIFYGSFTNYIFHFRKPIIQRFLYILILYLKSD